MDIPTVVSWTSTRGILARASRGAPLEGASKSRERNAERIGNESEADDEAPDCRAGLKLAWIPIIQREFSRRKAILAGDRASVA